MNKSYKNAKDFLVSTADFAMYYDEILVCTGTTNLNTSVEVSMQEQNVNAGKGNQLIYSYKYGRELNVTLEAADFKIEYIAANLGSKITEGLDEVYKFAECVQIINGIGVLKTIPVGDVAIELNTGVILTVTPEDTSIDLTKFGVEDEVVKATYRYSKVAKSITIDSETAPFVYKLVLDAEKHNNRLGRVGHVQVIIPSYQPSGNFTMSFTPDGVSSTSVEGKALSVEGDTCADGSAVYAYIKEFDETEKALNVAEVAATPATIELDSTQLDKTSTISVVGLKGALYSPIEIANNDCEFVCDSPDIATVDETGLVTAVKAGSAKITVQYNGISDEVDVVVK